MLPNLNKINVNIFSTLSYQDEISEFAKKFKLVTWKSLMTNY